MGHLDDEQLSLLALGEDLGTSAALHVARCPSCAETLKALQHTVRIATTDLNSVELEEPGGHNWAAIHSALGLSPSLAVDPLSRSADAGAGTPGPVASTGTPDRRPGPGMPTPLWPNIRRPRRKGPDARNRPWILGIAAGTAAGLIIGAWVAVSILGPASSPISAPSTSAPTQSGPTAVVLAEAPLQPLAAHSASGDAVVERLADGSRQLVIRLPNEPLPGFREVWVGSADLSRMVSLGVLGNQGGVFTLPSGLDLAQYPTIDISSEPYDGDPAHSAESVARGVLTLQG
jgi:hypothetical protein